MNRRTLLKQLGSITGVGALTSDALTVVSAKQSNDLIRNKVLYSEVEFNIVDSEKPLPLVASCVQYPKQKFSHLSGTVFVNQTDYHQANVGQADKLIASHAGTLEDEEILEFSSIPEAADLTGNTETVAGSESVQIQLEKYDSRSLQLSLGDAAVEVDEGATGTDQFKTEINYGNDESALVTIELSATHRGRTPLIGHPRNLMFPKNNGMKKVLDQFKVESRRKLGPVGQSKGQNVRIKEHRSAYELVLPRGDT